MRGNKYSHLFKFMRTFGTIFGQIFRMFTSSCIILWIFSSSDNARMIGRASDVIRVCTQSTLLFVRKLLLCVFHRSSRLYLNRFIHSNIRIFDMHFLSEVTQTTLENSFKGLSLDFIHHVACDSFFSRRHHKSFFKKDAQRNVASSQVIIRLNS